MSIKKIFQNVLALSLGFFFIFIILEIVFTFLLPASKVPKSMWNQDYKIPSFKPGTTGKYSIGKYCYKAGEWYINNEGWNSPYDYLRNDNQTIAIFGDSYIEALQVDIKKSLGPILQEKLGNHFNVYSFGTSGAPLSQYLQLARYAHQKFAPSIMVLNLVHNDFDESIAGETNSKIYLRYRKMNDSVFMEDVIEKFPEASLGFNVLNSFATGRYLIHNLKIREIDFRSFLYDKKNVNESYNANTNVNKVLAQKNEIKKVTEIILLQFKKEFPSTRLILLMDGLRKEIYQNTPLQESNIFWMNTMVKDLASQHKIEFLDLTIPFRDDFKKRMTHFEFPFDWHWNEHGHKIAAESLLKQITSKRN
jgi:hypothetical protein